MSRTNLPAANAKKEANDVALLLLLKLFEVFEGTHFDSANTKLSSVSRWLQKKKKKRTKRSDGITTLAKREYRRAENDKGAYVPDLEVDSCVSEVDGRITSGKFKNFEELGVVRERSKALTACRLATSPDVASAQWLVPVSPTSKSKSWQNQRHSAKTCTFGRDIAIHLTEGSKGRHVKHSTKMSGIGQSCARHAHDDIG